MDKYDKKELKLKKQVKSFLDTLGESDGVDNLKFYLDVIWADRMWDWIFIFELLERKLDSLIEWWPECCHIGWEEELVVMKKAKSLLVEIRECDNFDPDKVGLLEKELWDLLMANYRIWWD